MRHGQISDCTGVDNYNFTTDADARTGGLGDK